MVTQTQPENWPRIQLVNVDITFWTYWAYFYFPNLDLETALGAMKNVAGEFFPVSGHNVT